MRTQGQRSHHMRALRAGHVVKPGDVVEFKAGLHGIDAPRNLAVFVRRWKKKGTPWVEVVTVDGRKEIRADHLSRRAFRDRVEQDLGRTEEVVSRLRMLLEVHADGKLEEQLDDDLAASRTAAGSSSRRR